MIALPPLTGVERFLGEQELIVSKTDRRGLLTYCNDVFRRISGFTDAELIGRPHSLVRHPEMPRTVFHLLWETIESGREIFAYVVNRSKNGDHYWVLAHVTPTFDRDGTIIGFHSNRRCPDRSAIEKIRPLYAQLRDAEQRAGSKEEALRAGRALLAKTLAELQMEFDAFSFSLVESDREPATAGERR